MVEKEFIYLIDSDFLMLSTKTSEKVKLKTIENLAKVLRLISKEKRS